jgi:hypothetical protein
MIARLGALPPRKSGRELRRQVPERRSHRRAALSEKYESNVPGMYIVGALGGCPLIKQAMNQGYEVIEHILGRPVEAGRRAAAGEKFAGLIRRTASVAECSLVIQKHGAVAAGLTTLQLREFMLESELRRPKAGEVIFERNDYTNSFFSDRGGKVVIEGEGRQGRRRRPVLLGRQVLRRAGPHLRPAPLVHRAAARRCILVETPRRAMLKLLGLGRRVRKENSTACRCAARCASTSPEHHRERSQLRCRGRADRHVQGGTPLFNEGDAPTACTSSARLGHDLAHARRARGGAVLRVGRQLRGRDGAAVRTPRARHVRAAVPTEAIVLDAERSPSDRQQQRHARRAGRAASWRGCSAERRLRWRPVSRAASSPSCCSRASARPPTCC